MDVATKEAEIENKEEKIEFLEEILKMAEENPVIITDKGRGIFYADSRHVQEECLIGIKLDEKGKPYFTINGTYVQNNNMITKPEILLIAGDRYLSTNLDKFKQSFHLYKNRRKDCKTDLLNKIR